MQQLKGLLYRDATTSQIVKNPPVRCDLATKNVLPAWHHFNLDFYAKAMYLPYWGTRSAMPVLTGRGCVGHCAFCSPTIGAFRKRPIAHVIAEIEHLNARFDYDWLVFWNEMFYDSKSDILEFCDAYRKVQPRKPWVCALRTDAEVDRATFAAMKDAGCVSLSAGIESGSDKVLRHMRKNTTKEKTINFFRMAKETGMPCSGTFLVAHEGEAETDLKETIDMIISEEMTCGESLTAAYPGTLIYRNALKKGLIKDEWQFLEDFQFSPGVFDISWSQASYLNTSDIRNEDLWKVLVRELRRFHTFLLHRFSSKDIEYRTALGTLPLQVRAACVECGHPVVKDLPTRILGLEANCPSCFSPVIFDLYKCGAFSSHFSTLSAKLKAAHRILVIGVNAESCEFLKTDTFGLDYSNLLGFSDTTAAGDTDPLFIGMPRYPSDSLPNLASDIIVIIDERPGEAEIRLRLLYAKHGARPPEIVHLWPAHSKWSLRLVAAFNRLGLDRLPDRHYMRALRSLTPLLQSLHMTRSFLLRVLRISNRLRTSGIMLTIDAIKRKVRARTNGGTN